MNIVARAQVILECTFHEFGLEWDGTRALGWRSDPLFNPYEINSRKVRASWREFSQANCRFFDGPVRPPEEFVEAEEISVPVPVMRVYALPGLPVPYIPAVVGFRTGDERTQVGSFNSERLPKLRRHLHQVHALAPFEIWFANQDSFIGEFIRQPSEAEAEDIAGLLREAVPDGFRGVSKSSLIERIVETGSFMVAID